MSTDILSAIYRRQSELTGKFRAIELLNGFPHGYGHLDVSTHQGQATLRRECWQIVEELAEASEAASTEDAHVEIIDSLHFVIELALVLGINEAGFIAFAGGGFRNGEEGGDVSWITFIYQLALWANQLKLRPWKRQAPVSDLHHLRYTYGKLVGLFFRKLASLGFSMEEIERLYMNKAVINDKRIADGY